MDTSPGVPARLSHRDCFIPSHRLPDI